MCVCAVVLVLLLARCAVALEFYPYGPAYDSQLPRQDDISSQEIHLKVPIRFYDETYSSVFVNSNGILSFLTEMPMFFSIQFPLNYPIIAPLYANIDTSVQGQVYYRETDDTELLKRINDKIQQSYPLQNAFVANSIFIATWVEVGYYPRGVDKVNTFQAVVASDGSESYVLFLYQQGGVQWIQGQGEDHTSGLPGARAQAGFVAEDSIRLYTLRGSGTDQIKNLDRWSNTGDPGAWLFRVGNTKSSGNVEPPQVSAGDNDNSIEESSCQTGAALCHSKADCVDQVEGFCCVCQPGYYGNGRTCLQDQIPLRVNGKMSVSLNGEPAQELDVQAYIVTADGRSYTALSHVPTTVGKDAQLVTSTSDIIGWLFAKSVNNAPNGYQLTGGMLNHTARITFTNGQYHTTVEQRFFGLDVFDQIRMEGRLYGTVPQVPLGSKLIVPDSQSHFHKTSPGMIHSKTSYTVSVDNSPEEFPVTVEQTISYTEYCSTSNQQGAFRVKAARNFISFEETERILRFAATNKIASLLENEDPCVVGHVSCVNNSHCIPEGSTFHCACNNGFQTLYSEESTRDYGCIDINECQVGSHTCDENALCINEVGSFSCQCRPGFTGSGYHCQSVVTCSSIGCSLDAVCVESDDDGPHCFCKPGFNGDGTTCTPNAEDDCLECSPHAFCNHTQSGVVQCSCLPGYYGDGLECALAEDTVVPNCSQVECWCPTGYKRSGEICVRDYSSDDTVTNRTGSQESKDESCNTANNCHPEAQCIYISSKESYQCHCNAGYEGDGYDCSEIEISCEDAEICHQKAKCEVDTETGRSICMCGKGYKGDGTNCYPINECNDDIECGEHGLCEWSEENQRIECGCEQGYMLDYKTCIKEGCEEECHENAECVTNPVTGLPQCICGSGYVGDGVNDCVQQSFGCNVLLNCAADAECLYVSPQAGYRCQCHQGYEGDGVVCERVNNCLNNHSLCDNKAVCVPGASGYVCQCVSGYIGNGSTCSEMRRLEGGYLLVNKGMVTVKIPQARSKSNPGRLIQIDTEQIAIGLDIDCVEGLVYWSDIASKVIKRSNLNGKDITIFVDKDIQSPEGLAVDWMSRKLYWTDSGKDVIKALNLDTGETETVISTGLVDPRGIAVHPTQRKLFWSDWNRAGPKLETANLDGTSRQTLISQGVHLPNSLAIDWITQELCWTDAGTKNIDCLNLNSGIRRTAVSNCSYPFGLAITNEKYFWTDWQTQNVESAVKYSPSQRESLPLPPGPAGKLYGIVAVPDSCPHV